MRILSISDFRSRLASSRSDRLVDLVDDAVHLRPGPEAWFRLGPIQQTGDEVLVFDAILWFRQQEVHTGVKLRFLDIVGT